VGLETDSGASNLGWPLNHSMQYLQQDHAALIAASEDFSGMATGGHKIASYKHRYKNFLYPCYKAVDSIRRELAAPDLRTTKLNKSELV